MIVLALLLLIAVVALVLFILLTGASETVLLESDQINVSWEPTALVVFLLGALTLLLAVVALGLLRGGTKRKVEQRRELKRLRRVEEQNAAERDRRGTAPAGAAAGGAAAGGTAAAAHDGHDRPATEPTPATHPQPTGSEAQAQPTQATEPSSTSSEGSWHDDPDPDKPTGRHERPI